MTPCIAALIIACGTALNCAPSSRYYSAAVLECDGQEAPNSGSTLDSLGAWRQPIDGLAPRPARFARPIYNPRALPSEILYSPGFPGGDEE